jgi:uncharacterized protein (TIGR03067 family)
MKMYMALTLAASLLLSCISSAEDAKKEATKKDRQLYQGTWQIVSLTVNGNKVPEPDAQKIRVINQADGAGLLEVEGKVVAKAIFTIDPTKKPKTIDLTFTEGDNKGKTWHGIYEVGKDNRKICYPQLGKNRPTEFSSTPENGHILAEFKRVKK